MTKADDKKIGTEDPVKHDTLAGGIKEVAPEAPEDNSLVAKIRRSGLFLVTDHVNGGDPYVGISPQNDPEASVASKRLSSVMPLDTVSPRTGMQVRPKSGDSFTVGEGFGPDSTPADWAKVTNPAGDPLFA